MTDTPKSCFTPEQTAAADELLFGEAEADTPEGVAALIERLREGVVFDCDQFGNNCVANEGETDAVMTEAADALSRLTAGAGEAQSAQNREWCFICVGADDDEGFDECGVCGRKANPMPYGATAGESLLGRAVRLARGEPTPDDVPRILSIIAHAKGGAALASPAPVDVEAATCAFVDEFNNGNQQLDELPPHHQERFRLAMRKALASPAPQAGAGEARADWVRRALEFYRDNWDWFPGDGEAPQPGDPGSPPTFYEAEPNAALKADEGKIAAGALTALASPAPQDACPAVAWKPETIASAPHSKAVLVFVPQGSQPATLPVGEWVIAYQTFPEPTLQQTWRHAVGPGRGQQCGWPTHWVDLPEIAAALRPAEPLTAEAGEDARDVLRDLTALVRGECPSLLNEDSGGDAALSLRIDVALSSSAPEAEQP